MGTWRDIMAAGASPTISDPKILYKGLLTTTLTTTLVTAPAGEAGVKIERIVLCNITGSAATVTLDHADTGGANPFKILSAASIPADGFAIVLELGLYLNPADLLGGGAGTGSAIHCLVYGIEMKD